MSTASDLPSPDVRDAFERARAELAIESAAIQAECDAFAKEAEAAFDAGDREGYRRGRALADDRAGARYGIVRALGALTRAEYPDFYRSPDPSAA